MRNELEKDIKRLQKEVATLKEENLRLNREKNEISQEYMDFKIRSDDIVTKLRGIELYDPLLIPGNISLTRCIATTVGKLAAASLAERDKSGDSRGSGAGKLYPPSPSAAANAMNGIRDKLNFGKSSLASSSAAVSYTSAGNPATQPGIVILDDD